MYKCYITFLVVFMFVYIMSFINLVVTMFQFVYVQRTIVELKQFSFFLIAGTFVSAQ